MILHCLGNWLLYLAALSGIAAFAYNYTGWFAVWLLICVLLLPLVSLLVALPAVFRMRLRISCPDAVKRGEPAFLLLCAEGSRFFCPLSVHVEFRQEDITEPVPRIRRVCDWILPGTAGQEPPQRQEGYSAEKNKAGKQRGSFRTGRAAKVRIAVDTSHTGLVQTTLRRASVTDLMGLFVFRAHVTGKKDCDILVLPTETPLHDVPDPWKKQGAASVPAQGFSEQQEIRGYRPGDAMRSVHWKLSAKTDDVLVREGVEPERRRLGITFDRTPDRDVTDAVYDCTDALLRLLLRDARTADIRTAWRCPDGTADSFLLRHQEDLPDLYRKLFSTRLPQAVFSDRDILHDAVLKDADAGYHISAAPEGVRIALAFSGNGSAGHDLRSAEPLFPIF